MSSISFPVAPPPVGVARPSQESEAQSAAAKPRARESKTAENPVAPQPVEAGEAGEAGPKVGIKLPPSTRLSIDFDKQAARYIYRLIDPVTREILREIPSEEALQRIRGLRATTGLAVDEEL
jgi:uncharacterized FlaG/YvyC family protein